MDARVQVNPEDVTLLRLLTSFLDIEHNLFFSKKKKKSLDLLDVFLVDILFFLLFPHNCEIPEAVFLMIPHL